MATATSKAAPAERIKMRLRKGDTVQVIAGKDKGKTGEVERSSRRSNRFHRRQQNLEVHQVTQWLPRFGTHRGSDEAQWPSHHQQQV